jgi:hypothetical protein
LAEIKRGEVNGVEIRLGRLQVNTHLSGWHGEVDGVEIRLEDYR